MRSFRNSIFALASANICWASASSCFLSRPCRPLVIDWIMFSAPFLTFVSMLSCFSSEARSWSCGCCGSSGVELADNGDWGTSENVYGGITLTK